MNALMLGKGKGTYIMMGIAIVGQVISWMGIPEVGDPIRDWAVTGGMFTVPRALVSKAGVTKS